MPKQGFITEKTINILQHHEKGLDVNSISAATGYTLASIYDALKRNGVKPNGCTRYDWRQIQIFYDEGNSMRECVKRFGMNMASLTMAVRRGELKSRSRSMALKIGHQLGKISKGVFDDKRRKALSDAAKERGLGGETYYRKYRYHDIPMDSQWEVDIAMWLDGQGIEWVRDKRVRFGWLDKQDNSHYYYPDFYLPAYNIYLDPKNKYLIEKDRFKIETVMKTHGIKIIWGLKEDVISCLESLFASLG